MLDVGDSRDGWQGMLALGVVLAGVIFFCPLGLGFALLDPDEGLHAAIAQEMAEKGDWLTPRLLGKPFFDKPILYFWAVAASLRVLGMHEAAVRLPGLLCGLLGAVTTGIVGWRMLGRPVGLLAGLFYTTTILPVALAQAAVHDVALIPSTNLALLWLWESDRAACWQTRVLHVLGIGVCLGLACLTKGLAGVALVGVTYGGYLLISGRLTAAACARAAAALALAALIASAWYVPVELGNPGYLHYYFVERHVLGYTTGTQRHGGAPWWYYLPVLLGGGLPWIAYLPVVVQDGWTRWSRAHGPALRGLLKPSWRRLVGLSHHSVPLLDVRQAVMSGSAPHCFCEAVAHCDPTSRGEKHGRTARPPWNRPRHDSNGAIVLLWCWLIGCTLFLSASQSKLATYLWPVFPAVAILAAVAWVRLLEGTLSPLARRSILLTFWLSSLGGVVLPPAAMLVAESRFGARFDWPVWTVIVVVAAGAWLPLWFLRTGRLRATLACSLLAVAAQYVAVMALVVPTVAATTSALELARYFNRLGRVPPRVLIVEERLGSLVFYLEPELRAGLREGQFEEVRLREWGRSPWSASGAVVALPERQARRAAGYFDLDGIPYRRAGRYRIYAVSQLESRILAAAGGAGTAGR